MLSFLGNGLEIPWEIHDSYTRWAQKPVIIRRVITPHIRLITHPYSRPFIGVVITQFRTGLRAHLVRLSLKGP